MDKSEESEDQEIKEPDELENSGPEQDDSEEEKESGEEEPKEEETGEEKADETEKELQEELETQKQEIRFRGFNPNEESDETYQTNYRPGKKGMKKFIIWLAILAFLALAIGWFATSVIFKGESEEEKIIEETPSPTTTSTPLSETEFNRSEWSFEVLNGSGVSGLAKKIADELESLGYKIIKVGNADKSDYEKTQIFVRDNLKDQVDKVIADIGDIIKIASVAGGLEDSTASAQIIIGKDTP